MKKTLEIFEPLIGKYAFWLKDEDARQNFCFFIDERKYNSENLDDMEIIWYKLKDEDGFNLKCGILTLMFEALSTLG